MRIKRLSTIFLSLFASLVSIIVIGFILNYTYYRHIKENNFKIFLLNKVNEYHDKEFFWADKILFNSTISNKNIVENNLLVSKNLRILNTGAKINDLYVEKSEFSLSQEERKKLKKLNILEKEFYQKIKDIIELKSDIVINSLYKQLNTQIVYPNSLLGSIESLVKKHNDIVDFIKEYREELDQENTRYIFKINLSIFIILILFLMIIIVFYQLLNSKVYHSLTFIKKISEEALNDTFRENINVKYATLPEEIIRNLKKLFDKFQKTNKIIDLISKGKEKEVDEELLGNSLLKKSFKNLISNLIAIKSKEEERRKTEEEEKWISEGVMQISEVFKINNENVVLLAEEIISQLVNYTRAAQGAVFIYDEDLDSENLKLVAGYAYDRKRYIEDKVSLGSGLVGACAKEKHSIILKQVPEEYYKIGTAMGESSPQSIYLYPLLIEDNLLGVIELASFDVLGEKEIKYIEKVASNISISLSNAQNNLKTVRLLEQSRSQNEEIEFRETKLQNIIEEHQEHKIQLENQKKEFEEYLKAINTAVAIISINRKGEINNMNENARNILRLKGKTKNTNNLLDFKDDAPSSRILFKENLEMTNQGNLIRQESAYIAFDKKPVHVYEFWNPVKNRENKIEEILILFIDISLQKQNEILLKEHAQEVKMQEAIMKQNLEEMMVLQQNWADNKKVFELEIEKMQKRIKELEKELNNKN